MLQFSLLASEVKNQIPEAGPTMLGLKHVVSRHYPLMGFVWFGYGGQQSLFALFLYLF